MIEQKKTKDTKKLDREVIDPGGSEVVTVNMHYLLKIGRVKSAGLLSGNGRDLVLMSYTEKQMEA